MEKTIYNVIIQVVVTFSSLMHFSFLKFLLRNIIVTEKFPMALSTKLIYALIDHCNSID